MPKRYLIRSTQLDSLLAPELSDPYASTDPKVDWQILTGVDMGRSESGAPSVHPFAVITNFRENASYLYRKEGKDIVIEPMSDALKERYGKEAIEKRVRSVLNPHPKLPEQVRERIGEMVDRCEGWIAGRRRECETNIDIAFNPNYISTGVAA